jgi:hypothetical protein
MHWINLLIVSGLLAIIGYTFRRVRAAWRADREQLARRKRFNMSADELRGTRYSRELHGHRIYDVPGEVQGELADLDE